MFGRPSKKEIAAQEAMLMEAFKSLGNAEPKPRKREACLADNGISPISSDLSLCRSLIEAYNNNPTEFKPGDIIRLKPGLRLMLKHPNYSERVIFMTKLPEIQYKPYDGSPFTCWPVDMLCIAGFDDDDNTPLIFAYNSNQFEIDPNPETGII